MAETEHFGLSEYEDLHLNPVNGTENGACLNGRCCSSYNTITCSYRYQGLKEAESYKHIYNDPEIDERYHLGGTDTRGRVVAAISNAGVRRVIPVNAKVAIDIAGEQEYDRPVPTIKAAGPRHGEKYKHYRDDAILKAKKFRFLNFTVGSVPYQNQVHHVLNHSSLREGIKSFKNIPDVIAQGLLEEKYNINYKKNMVILPTSDKISEETGLPVHGGHPNYNMKILREVTKALKGYKSINKQAGKEDHPKPDPVPVKGRLKYISQTWYKKIMDTVPGNKKGNLIKVDQIK